MHSQWLCRVLAEAEDLCGIPLSVDTYHAEVARQGIEAGAHIVNDVSGGSLDPDMHAQVRDPEPVHLHCNSLTGHIRPHAAACHVIVSRRVLCLHACKGQMKE